MLVVAAAVLIVAGVALIARHLPRARARPLVGHGLAPGVYLLTSADCGACDRARSTLRRRGIDFAELAWHDDQARFESTGVDAVPSVIVVSSDGAGRWWRGGVPPRLGR